jgi:predicted flap endonuclease-1-like 5' DNA nuclease
MIGKLIKRLLGRDGAAEKRGDAARGAAGPAKPQAKGSAGGKSAAGDQTKPAATAKAGKPGKSGKAKAAGDKAAQSKGRGAKGGAPKAAPATPSAGAELTKVKGIGATTAESLAEMGIASLADLAAADPNAIAKRLDRPGLTPMRVRKWVDEAKQRLDS